MDKHWLWVESGESLHSCFLKQVLIPLHPFKSPDKKKSQLNIEFTLCNFKALLDSFTAQHKLR